MSVRPSETCLNCGARSYDSEGLGPICWIEDTKFELLRAFFLKQLDDCPCQVCNEPLGFQPTVVLLVNENTEFLCAFGDVALSRTDEERVKFLEDLQSPEMRAEVFATPDNLRSAYAKRVASTVDLVNSAKELILFTSDGLDNFLAGEWRSYTSNQFAAVALALTTQLPGFAFSFPDGPEEAFTDISRLQRLVWLSLWASWSGDLTEGQNLERDLKRYMAPGIVLHKAADEFLQETKSLDEGPIAERFSHEAMSATLCASRQQQNPRVRIWADLFVAQEVERRIFGEQSSPLFVAMEISSERARATIPYEELFDACQSQLLERGVSVLPHLHEIGLKVGYPDLGKEQVNAMRAVPKDGKPLSIDEFVETVFAHCRDLPVGLSLWIASSWLNGLSGGDSVETLCDLAKRLKEVLRNDAEIQIEVDCWLYGHLTKKGFPNMVLERIGDKAQPWEQELSSSKRVDLWTERSNALRMCGRRVEAISVAESVIRELESSGETISPILQRNLGILYREAGRHEKALEVFLNLLPNALRDLDLLDSIVVTYASLGRTKEMKFCLEKMLEFATGPHAEERPLITSTLAAVKAYTGEINEALDLLRQVELDANTDPRTFQSYASGWTTVLTCKRHLEEADEQRLQTLILKLKHVSDETRLAGNVRTTIDINRLLAMLFDLTERDEPNIYWGLVDADAREFEGAPDPMALLALARNAWDDELYEQGMNYLLELPSAVTERYGQEQDVGFKSLSLSHLGMLSDIVAERVLDSGSLSDVRVVAEVIRDLLGRITPGSSTENMPSSGFVAPNDEEVSQLGGPTAVFEWVAAHRGLIGIVTVIAEDETVTEWELTLPDEIDLQMLGERLLQRLSVWHPDRSGSPLDLKDWHLFEDWVVAELEARLPEGGHLVVIEHESVAHLPWHLAAAPRWRVSYSPSWSALLSARTTVVGDGNPPVGLALVPKYRESVENLKALEKSLSHTRELTTMLGLEFKSALREGCDHEGLVRVLQESRVAKLLCHGFVDPDNEIVALMVAHDGELPLGNSVAANSPSGRLHRFDWRDCQLLNRTPVVIFSAACKSGHSHYAGFGEKLGLFSTMRRTGTRSVVAPRWDIEPKVVLPILDSAMEKFLRTGTALGEALHAACSEAGEVLPRWEAWALALEGDWK